MINSTKAYIISTRSRDPSQLQSMHIWPLTRLDNITWSFTFDSIIRSFWHNYISLWECLLIFLLDRIAFDLLKNHTLYFWSLSLFPSQVLVCVTSFCSSISLFIWKFTFGELFLAKTKKKRVGRYIGTSLCMSQDQQKPFTNHSWQV